MTSAVSRTAEVVEKPAEALSTGGAAARAGGSVLPRVLQSGGNTITKGTAEALNKFTGTDLHSREWGRALEALKGDLKLGNGHHGKILSNGSYADEAGEVLGNILDYVE